MPKYKQKPLEYTLVSFQSQEESHDELKELFAEHDLVYNKTTPASVTAYANGKAATATAGQYIGTDADGNPVVFAAEQVEQLEVVAEAEPAEPADNEPPKKPKK